MIPNQNETIITPVNGSHMKVQFLVDELNNRISLKLRHERRLRHEQIKFLRNFYGGDCVMSAGKYPQVISDYLLLCSLLLGLGISQGNFWVMVLLLR